MNTDYNAYIANGGTDAAVFERANELGYFGEDLARAWDVVRKGIRPNDRVRIVRPEWTGERFEDVPGVVVYHVVGVEGETAWIETRAPGAVRFPRQVNINELTPA